MGELWNRVILRCVVGSRAYGLDRAASDTDRRGAYLPPAAAHWSLARVPEQLADEASDEVYWEIGKFVRLALAANPTVLETLFSPIVEHATPTGRRLIDARDVFLSRRAADTFGGYARQQLAKAQRRLDRTGSTNPKHLMHCLRLLHAGLGLVRTGTLAVEVGALRPTLLAVRDGRVPMHDVLARADELQGQIAEALPRSPLPPEPDRDAADRLLIAARRAAVEEGLP